MVDPRHVDELERPPEALDPPVVSGGAVDGPLVQRVAPELAGRREVIRRHARHELRPALLVQLEQVGVRPDVGRITGHEDRRVAEQLDAEPPGVLAEVVPLAEKEELPELL